MIKDLVKEEEFHIAIGLNLVEEMKPKELLDQVEVIISLVAQQQAASKAELRSGKEELNLVEVIIRPET